MLKTLSHCKIATSFIFAQFPAQPFGLQAERFALLCALSRSLLASAVALLNQNGGSKSLTWGGEVFSLRSDTLENGVVMLSSPFTDESERSCGTVTCLRRIIER